jgi:hypothetical protein
MTDQPDSLNEFQTIAKNRYADGCYDCIEESQGVRDTLFLFVMRELGDAENKAHAVGMLETAIRELKEVCEAVKLAGT